jgi:hypothetical protein
MLWIDASNRLNDSSEQSEMAGPSLERGTTVLTHLELEMLPTAIGSLAEGSK